MTLQSFLEQLLPIMGTVVSAVVSYVLTLLAKRYQLQLTQEQEHQLRTSVRSAIAGAEEWGARKMNAEKLDYVEGKEKAEYALSIIKTLYPKAKETDILKIIDCEIATMQDIGATKKKIDIEI
jgi:hypothetical protein